MTAVIRTEALTKKYRRVAALDHIDLEIQEGAVYALVGQNGAGKTTAIKILMNLISASEGTAEVLGTDSRKIRGKAYTQIGYVSENQEMPEWMRVGALLEYLRDFYPTWDLALEQSLVKQFELPLERKIKALSRGMKMKLALAGALAFHPPLIVLDEPFGGLDPLVEIESFASHVGYLDSGKLLFSEDMTSLSTRFREVEVTRDSDEPLPLAMPNNWLQPKSSGVIVRFVESRFDEQRTPAEIKIFFGTVKDAQYRALSLRAIFLAMARKSEEG
jgi:ABC-2 type transport system ATP-binding protein